MTVTKHAFGQFIATRRHALGITQKDLAQRLYVTESAVSKWERGVSYPAISLVAALARALEVSETALINASEDHIEQQVAREARFYRRWRRVLLVGTTACYALALLASLIVNLAVDGSLTWFWTVLASLAVAASLTTLPLLQIQRRGWTVLGALLATLTILLVTVWLQYERGPWLVITLAALAFATVLIFGPLMLRALGLPTALQRHLPTLALGIDTVLLLALVAISMVLTGSGTDLLTQGLPITALALGFVWPALLIWQYVPAPRTVRAAIISAFVGIYNVACFNPLLVRITGDERHRFDLTRWDQDANLNGNVSLLVLIALLVTSLVLTLVTTLRSH